MESSIFEFLIFVLKDNSFKKSQNTAGCLFRASNHRSHSDVIASLLVKHTFGKALPGVKTLLHHIVQSIHTFTFMILCTFGQYAFIQRSALMPLSVRLR